jgi:hypothetical protein
MAPRCRTPAELAHHLPPRASASPTLFRHLDGALCSPLQKSPAQEPHLLTQGGGAASRRWPVKQAGGLIRPELLSCHDSTH